MSDCFCTACNCEPCDCHRHRAKFIGRCTNCRKAFEVTAAQHAEARDIGCLFSACCAAVATFESVSVQHRAVRSARRIPRKPKST